jgi:hypothetical protein
MLLDRGGEMNGVRRFDSVASPQLGGTLDHGGIDVDDLKVGRAEKDVVFGKQGLVVVTEGAVRHSRRESLDVNTTAAAPAAARSSAMHARAWL